MKCPHCQKPVTVSVRDILAGNDAHGVLAQVLSYYASNFWGWQRDSEAFRGLSFNSKGQYSVTGVAKSYSGDGTPTVCFSSGMDVVSTLLALSGAIGRGDWKPDQWSIKQKNGENGRK